MRCGRADSGATEDVGTGAIVTDVLSTHVVRSDVVVSLADSRRRRIRAVRVRQEAAALAVDARRRALYGLPVLHREYRRAGRGRCAARCRDLGTGERWMVERAGGSSMPTP